MGKDVNKRLRALEGRVHELEAKPIIVLPYWYPSNPYVIPYYPPYWQIPSQWTIGDPLIATEITTTCNAEPMWVDARG